MYRTVTVNNVIPRRDIDGNVLDAHGGPLFNRFGDRFYNYGVHYMDTDGFSHDQHYCCYSSPNLVDWTFHGPIFGPGAPRGHYFRPHVLYNEKTGTYVLWFLFYEKYVHEAPNQCIKGVAVSDSPTGPFTIHKLHVELSRSLSGDHDLYLDEDGTAYLVYSAHDFSGPVKRATIVVERLSDDFLSSTGEHAEIDAENIPCEAPAMFKRGGMYYFMFDKWTDRGPEGSGARVYTADTPLGPYRYRGNVNRDDDGTIIIPAQQNTVAPIRTPPRDRVRMGRGPLVEHPGDGTLLPILVPPAVRRGGEYRTVFGSSTSGRWRSRSRRSPSNEIRPVDYAVPTPAYRRQNDKARPAAESAAKCPKGA